MAPKQIRLSRIHGLLHVVMISIVSSAVLFSAAQASAARFRRGSDVDVSGSYNEALFVSGQNLRVTANSTDDIFIAGGQVSQSGGTSENLFVAGGELSLSETKGRLGTLAGGEVSVTQGAFHDVIAAGGSVRLENSHVDDDVIIAGGRVRIGSEVDIADFVMLAGREIIFGGKAGGDVELAGKDVTIAGTVGKNLRVRGQHVVVKSTARIEGDFSHGVQSLEIEPGAVIKGKTVALPVSEVPSQEIKGMARGLLYFFGLIFGLGSLLAPAAIAAVFPRFVRGANDRLRGDGFGALGRGALILIAMPALLIALFVTIAGVPLALSALAFYIVAWILAWVVATFAAGHQLKLWIKHGRTLAKEPVADTPMRRRAVFGWTLFGAFALLLLLWIPFLGAAFNFLLTLAALGAVYLRAKEQ